MTASETPAGCWPTEYQELLLRACLLDGDQALDAWRRWEQLCGLDSVDQGSYRLLPLLYTKLRLLGVEHPTLGKLKGIHRRAWSETRVLTWKLAPAIRLLEQNGIPTVMLKGVPLAALFYGDIALRPMSDVDVLVPEDHALNALDLLQRNGWTHKEAFKPLEHARLPVIARNVPKLEQELHVELQNGVNLADSEGREVDLHWNVLPLSSPGAEQPFWDCAVPFRFEGVETRTLCPTDHLLHTCAHGLMWNTLPTIRWVADSAMIIRRAPIDWNRLVTLSDRLLIALPVSDGLHYLANIFGMPVPADVLGRLARLKVARKEQDEYKRLQAAPPEGPVGWIRSRYQIYSQRTRGRSVGYKVQLIRRQGLLWLGRVLRARLEKRTA